MTQERFSNLTVLNSHKEWTTKFAPSSPTPPAPIQKRWSPTSALKKLLRGPCWNNNSKQNRLSTYSLETLHWRYFFPLWDISKPGIKTFIEQANLHHPTIKFTAEISDTESVFLDMVVQPRSQGSLLPVGERTWEQGWWLYTKAQDSRKNLSLMGRHI